MTHTHHIDNPRDSHHATSILRDILLSVFVHLPVFLSNNTYRLLLLVLLNPLLLCTQSDGTCRAIFF